MKSTWIQFGLGAVIIVAGCIIGYLLFAFGESAVKSSGDEVSTPVSTVNVQRGAHAVTVQATGVVTPHSPSGCYPSERTNRRRLVRSVLVGVCRGRYPHPHR